MLTKDSEVCKNFKLVEAVFYLELIEIRLIILALSKVKAINGDDFDCKEWINIDVAEYCNVFDVKPGGQTYRNLKNAIETLYERRVFIPTNTKATVHKTRWVQDCKYRDYDGAIKLRFTESIKPFLVNLDHYIKYKIGEFAKLTSIYAVRLYEIALKWSHAKTRIESIDSIRTMFCANEKYNDFANFKNRIIEPALKQINERTNLKVRHTYIKTGRKITHVKFDIVEKGKKPAPFPTEKQFYAYVEIKKLKGLDVCYSGESWQDAYDRMVKKGTEASHLEIMSTIKKFKQAQQEQKKELKSA